MTHRADYSDQRRIAALSWLRDHGIIHRPDLNQHSKILAAIGCLICDADGSFSQAELDSALTDPELCQAAETLLQEAAQA